MSKPFWLAAWNSIRIGHVYEEVNDFSSLLHRIRFDGFANRIKTVMLSRHAEEITNCDWVSVVTTNTRTHENESCVDLLPLLRRVSIGTFDWVTGLVKKWHLAPLSLLAVFKTLSCQTLTRPCSPGCMQYHIYLCLQRGKCFTDNIVKQAATSTDEILEHVHCPIIDGMYWGHIQHILLWTDQNWGGAEEGGTRDLIGSLKWR